jgi:hypothetical protein
MNPAKINEFTPTNGRKREAAKSRVRTRRWKTGLALGVMAGLAVSQQVQAAVASRTAGKTPVKVFILAGQSNMEGYGGIQTMDE